MYVVHCHSGEIKIYISEVKEHKKEVLTVAIGDPILVDVDGEVGGGEVGGVGVHPAPVGRRARGVKVDRDARREAEAEVLTGRHSRVLRVLGRAH